MRRQEHDVRDDRVPIGLFEAFDISDGFVDALIDVGIIRHGFGNAVVEQQPYRDIRDEFGRSGRVFGGDVRCRRPSVDAAPNLIDIVKRVDYVIFYILTF